MLVIRLQRTGRKGHAMFRIVVQDSRLTPTSGKIVTQLGSYDPHTKAIVLDKEKAAEFVKNGAKPSPRMVALLKAEGVKMPEWVKSADKQTGKIRNPEKLRRNQPKEEKPAEEPEAAAEAEAPEPDAPAEAEEVAEKPAEEEKADDAETKA